MSPKFTKKYILLSSAYKKRHLSSDFRHSIDVRSRISLVLISPRFYCMIAAWYKQLCTVFFPPQNIFSLRKLFLPIAYN